MLFASLPVRYLENTADSLWDEDFAAHDPDIGYTQGMPGARQLRFVAASLGFRV